ncbi:MAG TPA: deoxyribose-phosphate aldolase [Candidatus Dormibacteraeota bacterium]|nr:deoxyribose-phosphate aldolase [Candidatus Dormibacteraeota bacterium]
MANSQMKAQPWAALDPVSSIDAVGVEARARALAGRSVKRSAKLQALDLAIRCIDLTTLEGSDTAGRVAVLCAKALHPTPESPDIPTVAAVCVYPAQAARAAELLRGSSVRVAAVATGFPSGQVPRDIKVAEAAEVAQFADEIDMVIDRGAFLAGRYRQMQAEIGAVKDAIGPRHLKVILETGELGGLDQVRRASWLAMEAGADFIKTSTGKIEPAATLPVAVVMLEAIRDFAWETGRRVGFKPAGGIRTSKQAIAYLVAVSEILGGDWLTPERFRLGASSLLNDILMQIYKERSGGYQSADDFTQG